MPAKTADGNLRPSRLILYFGMILYVTSFFLIAVDDHLKKRSPDRGYDCALWSLPLGFIDVKTRIFGPDLPLTDSLVASLCLLASGLINPMFGAYGLGSWLHHEKLAKSLAVLIVAFAPCCWVFFHYQHMSPREGYWLWTFGMLLVLSSPLLNRYPKPLRQTAA